MKLVAALAALTALTACSRAESQGGEGHSGGLTLEQKLPTRFAQLSNVIELGNGRVAFADTKAKLFLTADLRSGKVDTLGTRVDSLIQGAPATQYKFPGWVAHLAGDTVALVDFSGLRTTLWNEQGQPLGVLRLAPVAGNAPVLIYDTVGHGYKVDYQAIIGGAEPGRTVRPDSVPVLRISLKSGQVDTVANLASPEFGDARFGEETQQAAKVFAPNDYFGILPNGTAWLARGHENRVDWRDPSGAWTRGRTRDYPKLPVTQADRDRVLAQVREHGKQFGMPQNLAIEYPFAETKPAFDFALGRPSGEVWLQRPRATENGALTYDVFDRQGAWQRAVEFPKGTSLAGFGTKGAIYGSVREADGSHTVGRYSLK
jgi:hypothetical protein